MQIITIKSETNSQQSCGETNVNTINGISMPEVDIFLSSIFITTKNNQQKQK